MRKLVIIIFLLAGIRAFAQDTVYYADSAYVYNDGASSGNIIITDTLAGDVHIIERNTISTNRTGGLQIMVGRDNPSQASVGIVDSSVVRGNLIQYTGTASNGLHGGMDGYSLIGWYHNKFVDCGYGIVSEGTTATIHNGNWPIMYNIIKARNYYGLTVEGQNYKDIFNNTFVSLHHLVGYLVHFNYNSEANNANTTYAEFKNNLIYSAVDSVVMFIGETEKLTFESDYNVYYCETSVNHQPYFYVAGNSPEIVNFTQWKALGYDSHSYIVDPNFVDTVDFVPGQRMNYGTNLGARYDAGLSSIADWTAGSYPDTILQQGETWQVGAVLLPEHADYYCAPWGNDANAGTFTAPFKTFQKAIETATAGDTVYFRNGSYFPTSYEHGSDIYYYVPGSGYGHSGTSSNRIVYANYPGDEPVFDLDSCTPSGEWNVGVYFDSVHFVTFKGLTFQNLAATAGTGPVVHVFSANACSNFRLENMVFKDNGGAGFRYFGGMGSQYGVTSDSTYVINSDFFRNINTSGGHGDGIKIDQDKGAYFYFYGNRFIGNADDGLDVSGSAVSVIKNNWSFGNGVNGGDGNGFKLGAVRDSTAYPLRIVINNLAAFNYGPTGGAGGFDFPDYVDATDSTYQRANARIYNNTSYHNDIGFLEFENLREPYRNDVYRNNIAYGNIANQDGVYYNVSILGYVYEEDHNTWDFLDPSPGSWPPWFEESDTFAVSNADFVLTDSTQAIAQLLAPRKADGSLPDITFMKLKSTSDLINAGTTVGWNDIESLVGSQVYYGLAPDLGYSEYGVAAIINNPYDGVDFTKGRKSALHMHTKESDGEQTVAQRLIGDSPPINPDGFVDSLYSILAITDHDSYEADPYGGEYSGVGSTWPWNRYTGLTGYSQSHVWRWNGVDTSSSYYDGLGNGTYAVRGNELTACQETTGANGLYTHINSYFSDLGYASCPVDNFTGYLDDIVSEQGMAVFNHPGRHTANAAFYNNYFDTYYGTAVGIEIHNAGDYRPIQNPRRLWDSINSVRPYDSLIWGFANPDVHQSAYNTDEWKDYNIHFMDTITEPSFRTNLQNGAFTAHWAGIFEDFGGDNNYHPTPRLTNVSIANNVITLTVTGCDSVRWFGNYSDTLTTGYNIDVTDYVDSNNFVRAELYKSGYITYTQPFGITSDTVTEEELSSANNITSFSIIGQTSSSINITNHTVTVLMSYGTNRTSLIPTIIVSSGATINPTSGTARNFTNPVTYTVTAEDGTQQTWTVTVTVAQLNANIKMFKNGAGIVKTW